METLPAIKSISDLNSYAEVMYKSGFFTDVKSIAQACVKIMAGQELGIPPIASMRGIYIVKGQISMASQTMASLIKRSGRYNYRVTEATSEQCRIQFFEDGEPCGESIYTMEDAKRAQLSSDTWKKHPQMMLFNRAMSNGAKMFCADIFHGPSYIDGELEETPIHDDSSPIPDMTASQQKIEVDNSSPSQGHLGVLFGHLKRLGVRDGHKRQLVDYYSENSVTVSNVTQYIKEMEYAVILPWDWFSSYVNMLLIEHPKYNRKSLGEYYKANFPGAKSGDLTAEQQSQLIDWLLMVEPDDIPDPTSGPTPEAEPQTTSETVSEPDPSATDDDTESVAETDTDDTYTPDATLAPSPWLAEITRVQNETKEDVEKIEKWLLKSYGQGKYKTVEDLPLEGIRLIQGMNAEAIRKDMDSMTML